MTNTLLIIGAGAAGSVAIRKLAMMNHTFDNIHVASRTLSKCQQLKQEVPYPLHIHQVDADDTTSLIELCYGVRPSVILNLALPYQDLSIMEACLAVGAHYIDTANYEPPHEAKFCYKWQWDYQQRFKDAGLTAILGCGFDPGVTNAFCAYVAKHYLDELHEIKIVDCNDGDHGHPFATNFNPEINIREITQKGKYFQDGKWHTVDALTCRDMIHYPSIGERQSFLIYHEELESLVKHFPHLKRATFWMTFSDSYLNHLKVLQNVGMTNIEPILFNGTPIAPIEFLKALLPDPASLASRYTGKTCIGVHIQGIKEGQHQHLFIYNNCDHEDTYAECQAQAVSFTTGVPAIVGAQLIQNGTWRAPGVWNVEQLDPDPFMKSLTENGLPWTIQYHDH